MEDNHKRLWHSIKIKTSFTWQDWSQMKRDLRKKQNIENSDSCAADLALPSNGEFSNYSGQGHKKNLKWMLEDGPHKFGS